jgi:hypothetical protein
MTCLDFEGPARGHVDELLWVFPRVFRSWCLVPAPGKDLENGAAVAIRRRQDDLG